MTGGSGSTSSSCGGTWLLGGAGVCGKGCEITKTVPIAADHNRVTIVFDAWFIDSWDDETLFLHLNDNKIWEKKHNLWSGKSNICGVNWAYDHHIRVSKTIEHTEAEAILKFSNNLDEGAANESMGLS